MNFQAVSVSRHGNSTGSGSGNSGQGAGISGNNVSLTNCTVTGNSAFSGLGSGMSGSSNTTVRNSIIAGNPGTGDSELNGTFTSQGHNLIGKSDGSNGFTNGSNGDQVGTTVSPSTLPTLLDLPADR